MRNFGQLSASGKKISGVLRTPPARHIDIPTEPTSDKRSNTAQSVLRACSVLHCFAGPEVTLSLRQVTEMCELAKPTAHRILITLVEGGILELQSKSLYSLKSNVRRPIRYRVGYAAQTEENSFSRLVTESIRSNAFTNHIELLALDNHYSASTALRNVARFVRESVDLVIEFQTNEDIASRVTSSLVQANIPLIAIEIPHPNAYFYGANNYRAGLIGGRALARACLTRWRGRVDEIVLFNQPIVGPLPQSRLSGTLAGLREVLPSFSDSMITMIDGRGRFETSLEAARKYLRRSQARRVLISGINDFCCLGALRAFEEAGRTENCLIVGQNGCFEARRELRRAGSPYIASVAYFPEQYGEAVIAVAIDLLERRNPPRSTFVKHALLTPENVDLHYPNDRSDQSAGAETLLHSIR
jgi:ribose transport system substrate-binding protein